MKWRNIECSMTGGFLCDAAEEWLDEAASAVVELGEAVLDRKETEKAFHMSLVMVCKNDH